jgi:uncharacterized YigZ family protein
MASYCTLSTPVSLEVDPTKKSRFIGDAAPVGTADDAMAFVRKIQALHPNAGHHCFAWRLEAGDRGWRSSDDGEPGGTAGMPILARSDGAGLRGVVVVGSRWFGGTKLGKGGLIRAYGGAAAETLATGEIIEVRETRTFTLTHSYEDQGAVDGVLRGVALQPTHQDFGAQVSQVVAVPIEEVVLLLRELTDRTAGRVQIDEQNLQGDRT